MDNSIRLEGLWDEGFAIDRQIVKSIAIGEDMYGNMRFDTTRSNIGELLYQMKYKFDYSKVNEIMETVFPFLDKWEAVKQVKFVIPVPPSRHRSIQPVNLLAESIAKHLNVGWSPEVLEKVTVGEIKGVHRAEKKQRVEGSIAKRKSAKFEHDMLLVDDLYESGLTLNECVRVLRQDSLIRYIYVLCMTKTKERI